MLDYILNTITEFFLNYKSINFLLTEPFQEISSIIMSKDWTANLTKGIPVPTGGIIYQDLCHARSEFL